MNFTFDFDFFFTVATRNLNLTYWVQIVFPLDRTGLGSPCRNSSFWCQNAGLNYTSRKMSVGTKQWFSKLPGINPCPTPTGISRSGVGGSGRASCVLTSLPGDCVRIMGTELNLQQMF